jgi:hypothetical protein
MAPRSLRFGMRSRKMSKLVGHWMGDQKFLIWVLLCFGSHVKPLVPAAFAVVSTNPHWASMVGYGPFSLCDIHKERLCPSSGHINRLIMMILIDISDSTSFHIIRSRTWGSQNNSLPKWSLNLFPLSNLFPQAHKQALEGSITSWDACVPLRSSTLSNSIRTGSCGGRPAGKTILVAPRSSSKARDTSFWVIHLRRSTCNWFLLFLICKL